MARNSELIEDIAVLAEKLDHEVDIEGFTNRELCETKKSLNALLDAREKAQEHEVAEASPEVAEAEEPKSMVMAKGKAITSKRGILSEGSPVRDTDFSEDYTKRLIEKGFIEWV